MGWPVNSRPHIALVIPARNEAACIGEVLERIPTVVTTVIVVDNGSTDETADAARARGARVIREEYPGYGSACLAGLAFLAEKPPDIVAFADADGSDGVQNLSALLQPIISGNADLTLALRVPTSQPALTFQQRFGNKLAVHLIRLFWGHNYHDLGPMRAITWQALEQLHMSDKNFGWTVEMQIKALKTHLRIIEIPLPYYERQAGRSKVSRTLSGVFKAGAKILWVIALELLRGKMTRQQRPAPSASVAITTERSR